MQPYWMEKPNCKNETLVAYRNKVGLDTLQHVGHSRRRSHHAQHAGTHARTHGSRCTRKAHGGSRMQPPMHAGTYQMKWQIGSPHARCRHAGKDGPCCLLLSQVKAHLQSDDFKKRVVALQQQVRVDGCSEAAHAGPLRRAAATAGLKNLWRAARVLKGCKVLRATEPGQNALRHTCGPGRGDHPSRVLRGRICYCIRVLVLLSPASPCVSG